MDILGQDYAKPAIKNKWKNAASDDLASVNSEIAQLSSKLSTLKSQNAEAKRNIFDCVQQKGDTWFGLYSCKNNTGKTINEWEVVRDTTAKQIPEEEALLVELRKESAELSAMIKRSAEVGESQARTEIEVQKASTEQAKSIGVWIGLGLLLVAGGAFVYFKYIKRK